MPNVAQTYDASNLRNHTAGTAIGLTIIQDTNSGPKAVYRYDNPNLAGTTRGHGQFIVAPNYQGGNVVVRAQYRASNNSGSLTGTQLTVNIKSSASTALAAVGSTALSPGTLTVPGTAGNIGELVFTITTGFLPATMYLVTFYLSRATSDTALGFLDILSYEIEYACDVTATKQYAWIPASVWQSIGGVATLGAPTNGIDSGVLMYPYTYQFPDSAGNAIGVKYTLPSTYTGNMKYYPVVCNSTNTGSTKLGMGMGAAGVGANYDPVPTVNTTTIDYTTLMGIGNAGAGIAAPISPSAGDTLSLQLTRDNTDANTGITNVFGVILEYDVFTASPSPVIQFNPTSLAPPTSGAASILAINDTNNSGYIVRFTQGVTTRIGGKRQNPGTYSSGGTFIGYFKTTAGSGNVKFHLEFANPAVGASSDPTLTSTATVTTNVTGANQIHRFVIDISPGLVALDEVIALLAMESTSTVAADVDYLTGWMEVGVLP